MTDEHLTDRERDAVATMRERAALQLRRLEMIAARDAAQAESDRLSDEVAGIGMLIAAASRRILHGPPAPAATVEVPGEALAVINPNALGDAIAGDLELALKPPRTSEPTGWTGSTLD